MTDVNPAIITENFAQKTLFVNARNNHLLNTYLGKSGMGRVILNHVIDTMMHNLASLLVQ